MASTNVKLTENIEENCDGNICFTLDGTDYGTGYEFNNDTYFLTSDGGLLFDDGTPIECESDYINIAIRNVLREHGLLN